MMAIGIIEAVLLALRIEVWTSGFEVRAFALGDLMEVDGMFSGWEIMKMKLDADARTFLPQRSGTNALALRIIELDLKYHLGRGRAPGWEGSQREQQSEGERGKVFHGFGASWQQKL